MLFSPKDIELQIAEWGMLPFFKGIVDGFSLEELISPDYWFPDGGIEGVWEWKNEIILDGNCAYGKFYRGKACFVSMDIFPDLLNYRRSRFVPSQDEQHLLDVVEQHESLLSRDLKRLCGYNAPRRQPVDRLQRMLSGRSRHQHTLSLSDESSPCHRKGFETAITRLQMGCRLLTCDFEYAYTRDGRRYGWSVARYCTPEAYFGAEQLQVPRSPNESYEFLSEYLSQRLPQATPFEISQIISG